MSAPVHTRIKTTSPHKVTLGVMAKTAREAARVWSIREFAAVLAQRAGPRDYVGQLRQIYDEITRRWRYVMEPDEFVHGTATSLLKYVLGMKYNAPGQDPTQVNIAAMPTTGIKGWGDCDDASELVASLAIAIGMPEVYFRIAENPGGAHVSVMVRTPKGEMVSVDPVGYPDHKFGWAMPAQRVRLYDVQKTKSGPMGSVESDARAMQHAETYFIDPGNQLAGGTRRGHWCAVSRSDFDGPRSLALPMKQYNDIKKGIVHHGMTGVDENGKVYSYCSGRDLWINRKLEGCPGLRKEAAMGGVFENGRMLSYSGGAANGAPATHYGYSNVVEYPMAGRRADARRKRRAERRRKPSRARKFFKRVGKRVRKVVARVLKSKWVQRVIGGILQSIGVPRRLTRGVIAAGGSIIEQGGIRAFIKLLRKDKRAAMRMVAAAGKAGLKGAGIDLAAWKQKGKALARKRMRGRGMRGIEDIVPVDPALVGMGALYEHDAQPDNVGTAYKLQQQSRRGRLSRPFSAAPVVAFTGAYGVIEVGDKDITPVPTPGKWYQIDPKVSKHLVGTAKIAYGTSGMENVARQKWINKVKANQYAFDPTATDNFHKNGKITFLPKFSKDPGEAIKGVPGNHWATIYIPAHDGDEPAETIPDTNDDDKDDDIVIPDVDDDVGDEDDLPDNDDTGDDDDDNDPLVGPPGETGPMGPQGVIGPDGLPGGLGPQGVMGPQGDAGPRGEPGVGEGSPGEMGPQGVMGPQGEMGPRGEPGVGEGSPGEMGPQGVMGPQGIMGPQGELGPEGSVGPIGPQGPAGEGGTGGGGVPGWVPVVAAMFIGGVFK